MWRATCSFPTYKSDVYRDYIKADFDKVDLLEVESSGVCHRVENINIRGHEGWNLTVPFWQSSREQIHTDSSRKWCEFNATQGSIRSEDNFGNYRKFNRAFRCTESDESTTQFWIGMAK